MALVQDAGKSGSWACLGKQAAALDMLPRLAAAVLQDYGLDLISTGSRILKVKRVSAGNTISRLPVKPAPAVPPPAPTTAPMAAPLPPPARPPMRAPAAPPPPIIPAERFPLPVLVCERLEVRRS